MNDPDRPPEGNDPAAERIDVLCDRFEAAWRSGPRPTIEATLASAPRVEPPELLRELLALEIELRRREGERPQTSEYLARFPRHRDLVVSTCAAALAATIAAASPELNVDGDTAVGPRFRILRFLDHGGAGDVFVA